MARAVQFFSVLASRGEVDSFDESFQVMPRLDGAAGERALLERVLGR